MSLLLRKVSNKNRWEGLGEDDWIPPGEMQADLLGDLNTSDNELSLWRIENDRSNVDRIIAAIAARRGKLDRVDFLLFDTEVLESLGIECRPHRGDSADPGINDLWHVDACELTASGLLSLAKEVKDRSEKSRILRQKVRELIQRSVSAGYIPREHITEKVLSEIDHETTS